MKIQVWLQSKPPTRFLGDDHNSLDRGTRVSKHALG